MERPVTDIAFVCSPDKVPKGYSIITRCPCSHNAQMWEKVLGGEDGERYFCFTKEDQGDDKVLVDMYIPGPSQQYLKKGYSIITDTVEGKEPLRHKQLAIKRVCKSEASTVIVDIIVCRSKDKVSNLYRRLSKVNGLRIAFREITYTPKQTTPPTTQNSDPVTSKFEQLSVTDHGKQEDKNQSSETDTNMPTTVPSSTPTSRIEHDSGEPEVRVEAATVLASAPPLPPTNPQNMSTYPPQPPVNSTDYASSSLPPPKVGNTVMPPSVPYQHPMQSTSVGTPYPPAPPPTQGNNLPYQMTPSFPQGPQTGFPMSMNRAAYDNSGGVYPSVPPPVTTGYDTSIGFSFGGPTSSGGATSLSGPAPYNPYHHQPQQQQPGYPTSHPGLQGNSAPWGRPPQSTNNYGFKF